jgi:aspartate-semialdehyde dehydrogenase
MVVGLGPCYIDPAMRICILGATGLVGRESIELIARAWPDAELDLYASRDQKLDFGGKQYEVKAASGLENPSAPRGDLAFVALDDEHSKRYVPRLLDLGYRVVDKSNTYRADPKVLLVTAGVNSRRVDGDVRLVANPNCTTIPLALALEPLNREYGLDVVTVSTYQAVSGAGIATLDSFLEESKKGYEAQDRLGRVFSPSGYAGNAVPHNGGTDESGYSSEERKLMFEAKKILELPELAVSAQCCRVAVAVGHYENVWVTCKRPVDTDRIAELLSAAPFVRFLAGAAGEGLSAVASANERDRALVGRLRRDPRDAAHKSFCLTVVGDNLRLGAATNAVRIASRWYPGRDQALNA